ncbi:MAG: hypothetical protein II079_09220 [Oscillospiraceae bacterium]|nr:hypothetical protein [Oscillospiraceae bacterium]
MEFVQEPDELVRYCHWYLRLPPAAVKAKREKARFLRGGDKPGAAGIG